MKVNLTRENVCAADDADAPHATTFAIPDETTVADLARIIQNKHLPKIQGGKATWSIVTRIPVAVLAQQWSEPKLLPLFQLGIAKLDTANGAVTIHVNYHVQQDPEVVLEVLRELKLMTIQQAAGGDAKDRRASAVTLSPRMLACHRAVLAV